MSEMGTVLKVLAPYIFLVEIYSMKFRCIWVYRSLVPIFSPYLVVILFENGLSSYMYMVDLRTDWEELDTG